MQLWEHYYRVSLFNKCELSRALQAGHHICHSLVCASAPVVPETYSYRTPCGRNRAQRRPLGEHRRTWASFHSPLSLNALLLTQSSSGRRDDIWPICLSYSVVLQAIRFPGRCTGEMTLGSHTPSTARPTSTRSKDCRRSPPTPLMWLP